MLSWHKSKYTHHEENACVEVGTGPGLVGVRDTKQRELPNRARPVLVFDQAHRLRTPRFLDRLHNPAAGGALSFHPPRIEVT